MDPIAIVFLTVNPPSDVFRFAESLATPRYTIFVCVDDNSYTLPEYDTTKLQVLRYEKGIAERHGYKNTVARIKCASSRCKALYYFSKVNTSFNNVWIVEEDVFIPTVHTIPNIDTKYPNADLLSAIHWINPTGDTSRWQWKRVVGYIEPPWAGSMVCGVRVSRRLLQCIAKYAQEKKTLFFDEAVFNTLALQNGLTVETPVEMKGITATHVWTLPELNNDGLYHPIKDLQEQKRFRESLQSL